MVEFQILCKVVSTGDYSIIENNMITADYFKDTGYEEEYQFIVDHFRKYGNVPDKETFKSRFRLEKTFIDSVQETDEFLVDALREAYTFRLCSPILLKAAKMADEDANAAVEYMTQALKTVQVNYGLTGVDIIARAQDRLAHYKERVENQDDWYFSTGFHELDNIIHGIQRFEELIVLFARLGQGKSWVLEKIAAHIWRLGFNVGYISPEMGYDNVGYRFDTVHYGYSNNSLMYGLPDVDIDKYEQDIAKLQENKNKFIVSTPSDFDGRITISKLRNYIKQYKLDVLAIDGVKYLVDERGRSRDNEASLLTHISEDLMALSVEMQVPIVIVSQANRAGATDDVPDVANIANSDGIGQCASRIIALRQDDGNLEMRVVKNRYGPLGKKLTYIWNINVGEWIYTESSEDLSTEERKERRERKKASGKDVF